MITAIVRFNVRPRIFSAICIFLSFLAVSGIARAELSVVNRWRIEQAIYSCEAADNALIYTDYWGETITEENKETVCIAEQYARLAVFEGEEWLENKAPAFIKECKSKSGKSTEKYYACLQAGATAIIGKLSASCKELGDEGLWEESRCRNLISYIFVSEFDEVLEKQRPFLVKAMDFAILHFFFNPITAIIFLFLFVFDMILLIDPYNWMRLPKIVFPSGVVVLVSLFLENEWRFLGMGIAFLIPATAIAWNHVAAALDPERKEKKKRAEIIRKLLQ